MVSSEQPRGVLRGHGDGLGSSAPDVYSVVFHSAEAHVVTAGHDRTVRLYDVESEQVGRSVGRMMGVARGAGEVMWHAWTMLGGGVGG